MGGHKGPQRQSWSSIQLRKSFVKRMIIRVFGILSSALSTSPEEAMVIANRSNVASNSMASSTHRVCGLVRRQKRRKVLTGAPRWSVQWCLATGRSVATTGQRTCLVAFWRSPHPCLNNATPSSLVETSAETTERRNTSKVQSINTIICI